MKVVIDGIEYVPAIALSANASVYDRALAAPMETSTVRNYLCRSLMTSWDQHLIYTLIDCGYIPGKLDYDIEDYDEDEADRLILELIQYVFFRQGNEAIA